MHYKADHGNTHSVQKIPIKYTSGTLQTCTHEWLSHLYLESVSTDGTK